MAQGQQSKIVSHEELAEILNDVDVSEALDIGVALVNIGTHKTLGSVICISGCGDASALIQLTG